MQFLISDETTIIQVKEKDKVHVGDAVFFKVARKIGCSRNCAFLSPFQTITWAVVIQNGYYPLLYVFVSYNATAVTVIVCQVP